MRKLTFLAGIILLSGPTFAQNSRNCGTTPHMEFLKQNDPKLQMKMDEIERYTTRYVEQHQDQKAAATYNIPVVVHVVYRTSAQNISDAQILSQIDVLNEDFSRTNTDASNTPSYFAGLAADASIQFCLASTDPLGNTTNGITRTSTGTSSFSSNDNMKSGSSGGKNAWPADQYLNIWVCNLTSGLLGYAQFPGGSASTDGVVIDYQYFGRIGNVSAPFDEGRTTTHEVGHWLNLYHIWGDSYCGNDNVSDTPQQSSSNGGCPSFPKSSCGNYSDMFMNYMDYTDDACMNMFSNGQKSRMHAVLSSGGFRSQLANSTACGGGAPGGGGTSNYCASTGQDASYEWIASVSIKDIQSNTSNNGGYADFTNLSTDMAIGEVVNVQLAPGFSGSTYNEYWKVWVDLNQNMVFEDSELLYEAGLTSANVSGTMQIPTGSATGPTRMRVSMKYNGAQTACESFQYGEVEDYEVNITNSAPTCDTPTGLSASSITTSTATVSWSNPNTSNNYMLQYRPTGNANWTSLSGSGSSASLSALTASTVYDYRVRSDCGSLNSAYSGTATFTTESPVAVSYCASSGSNAYYEWIARVKLNGIDNSSGNDGGYEDYTAVSTTLSKGSSNTISLYPGFRSSTYNEYWKVWIDLNQDGDFNDSKELVFDAGGYSSTSVSGTISIPNNATSGETRMRVTMMYNGNPSTCSSFQYGEVEDYTVVIGSSSRLSAVSNEVLVYPNPSSGVFTVRGASTIDQVEIYSTTGQLISTTPVNGLEHHVNIDRSGAFILKIWSDDQVVIRRVIVH